MKKTFLVFFSALLIIGNVSAQKGWQFGVRMMPTNSWLYNVDNADAPKWQYDYKWSFGATGGLVVGRNFSDHFGLQLNALYSDLGQRHTTKVEGYPDPISYTQRITYFKFPLMVSLNTNPYKKISYALAFGPQLDVLVNARSFDTDVRQSTIDPRITDYPVENDRFNKTLVSGVIDAGINVRLNYNMHLNLHYRFDYGFTDVEDKDAFYHVTENGIRSTKRIYDFDRDKSRWVLNSLVVGFTYTLNRY